MRNAEEPESLLCLQDVTKEFGSLLPGSPVRALASVSFDVKPGRIVGLIGPNGSGKTTALRIAAGILRLTRGSVRALGTAPGSDSARLRTGYMPEETGFPATLTPREVLDFFGRIFGMNASKRADRIVELEELLSMSGYMNRRMGKLSKGMYKKTGLASALFNDPQLLLLDEPLEGLDPVSSAGVKEHLIGLARKGAGILISSHILSDVESTCHEIIILDNGKVVLQGVPGSILAVRDRLEVRFEAESGEELLKEITRLIESSAGKVLFAGHPTEGLEELFKKIIDKRKNKRDNEEGGR